MEFNFSLDKSELSSVCNDTSVCLLKGFLATLLLILLIGSRFAIANGNKDAIQVGNVWVNIIPIHLE